MFKRRKYRSGTKSRRRHGVGKHTTAKSLNKYLSYRNTNVVETDHFLIKNGIQPIHKTAQVQFHNHIIVGDSTKTDQYQITMNTLRDPLGNVEYVPGFNLLGCLYEFVTVTRCTVEAWLVFNTSASNTLRAEPYHMFLVGDSKAADLTSTISYDQLREAKYPYATLIPGSQSDKGFKTGKRVRVLYPASAWLGSTIDGGTMAENNTQTIVLTSNVPSVQLPTKVGFIHFLVFDASGNPIASGEDMVIATRATFNTIYWGQRQDTLAVTT